MLKGKFDPTLLNATLLSQLLLKQLIWALQRSGLDMQKLSQAILDELEKLGIIE